MAGKANPIEPRRAPVPCTSDRHTKSKLWDGLALHNVDAVLAAATERRVPAKTVIISQNEPAEHLFLLTKGSARHFYVTEPGQKIILRWLVPGDLSGGRALLRQRSSYLLSTEVVKDSSVLVWTREAIHHLMTRYPTLAENALSLASEYLAWFLASHLALVSHSAPERLGHVLIGLAEGIGLKTPEGVELNITNEELANAANVTLFTACRILSGWRHSGALLKSRGKLVLRFPHKLLPNLQAEAAIM